MPYRNLYQRTTDGCLEPLNTEQCSSLFQIPVDNFNIDTDDWDYFLAWDGTTPAPMANPSADTTLATQHWRYGMSRNSTQSSFNSMVLDDAPFDIDEQLISPLSGQFKYDPDVKPVHQPLSLTEAQAGDTIRSYQAYSTLSIAEEKSLQDIAMPYRTPAAAIITAPDTPEDEETASSPEPKRKTRTNKRKSTELGPADQEGLCQSRKRGHNAIEKRYRTNLNDKIMALRESIPPLFTSLDSEAVEDGADENEDEKDAAQKYGKAAILTRAVEYITHLEDSTRRLGMEAVVLKARLLAFEKLAISGSIVMTDPTLCQRTLIAETLETIQAEFKAIKPVKAKSAANKPKPRASKRRDSLV